MKLPSPTQNNEDQALDRSLRPQKWNDYVGQEKIKKNLKILIEAAQKRSEPIEHVLLYGPAGLGKTTLAYIIAKELGTKLKITSGPAIEKIGDLAAILSNLTDNEVLFIDEAHRLNKLVEEILYPAMESRVLDIIIGKGPSARTLQLKLPPFTLIVATTRVGLLSSPFRSRFGVTFRLDFYNNEDIKKIIKRSAEILGVDIQSESIDPIAASSRYTPRVANRLLKRVRDYAQVHNQNEVTPDVVAEAMALLEIDHLGLEPTDRRILETIINKFDGGPVGLQSLAATTAEEIDTIQDIYEPYLLQLGMLARTPRGRVATKLAYKHMGFKYLDPNENNKLL